MIRYALPPQSFFRAHICQSIRVIECPEFRQLCMVLRESLVDADIPHRDKMKEAIMGGWQRSFKELKSELAVSLNLFSSRYITYISP